jgi:ADP-ribosylglycohydrolase
MRVAAVGWLARDEIEARDLAAAQAAVGHSHPDAIRTAQAASSWPVRSMAVISW